MNLKQPVMSFSCGARCVSCRRSYTFASLSLLAFSLERAIFRCRITPCDAQAIKMQSLCSHCGHGIHTLIMIISLALCGRAVSFLPTARSSVAAPLCSAGEGHTTISAPGGIRGRALLTDAADVGKTITNKKHRDCGHEQKTP